MVMPTRFSALLRKHYFYNMVLALSVTKETLRGKDESAYGGISEITYGQEIIDKKTSD